MILDLINHIFTETGRRWRIGGTLMIPTENHVKGALDEAARILYDKDVGSTLTTGGLYIEKRATGHDVYVYVGNYK